MSLLGKLRLLVAKYLSVSVVRLTDLERKVLERQFYIDKEIDFVLKGWIKFPENWDCFQIKGDNIKLHMIAEAIKKFVPRANNIDVISLYKLAEMVGSDMSSQAYIGELAYNTVEVIVNPPGEWVSPFYQRLKGKA